MRRGVSCAASEGDFKKGAHRGGIQTGGEENRELSEADRLNELPWAAAFRPRG